MTHLRHLRALQAFDAAASRLNLSQAAQDLGVTHGAVSRQIKQLEQYLGTALFRRQHGGVQLTDAGARLYQATQDAFPILEQGVIATRRNQKRSSVTISLSSSLAIKWMVPRLQGFRQRHPEISVFLDTDDQLIDFRDSDVDVALRYGGDRTPGLYQDHLLQERLVVVAAPSLTPDIDVTPASIARLPLLHDRFHPSWDAWAQAAGQTGLGLQSQSTAFPDSAVTIAAAIDGQGAILVRHILVADDLAAGRLVHLSDVSLKQQTALYFVCRDGDQRHAPISTLQTWLMDALSEP